MKKINMSDIPKRTTTHTAFIIQNENVKFELAPDSYSINPRTSMYQDYDSIHLVFLNKDIREIFEPYKDQEFSIYEISENVENFYQKMRIVNLRFEVIDEEKTRIESSISFSCWSSK